MTARPIPAGGRKIDAGRTRRQAAPEHLTILVADDDPSYRRRIREALEADHMAVAEADDPASAIALAQRLRPDICLIELEPPEERLYAIGRIAKASPATLTIVLSRSARPDDVVNALTYGASGYLLKEISPDRLAVTLRAAYRGEPALPRALVPYVLDEIRRGAERRLNLPDRPVTLTRREWEVGDLLRTGHSTAEIAARLGLSPVTVRRHVGLLVFKLGVRDREAAVELLRAQNRR